MSGEVDQPAPNEIVIIRRRGGGEEDSHHGGVWKIAYADFMTAMMAFFLVMWLVNVSDKKIVTKIASYFNPMKMTDKVTNPKGVKDLTDSDEGQTSGGGTGAGGKTVEQSQQKKAADTDRASEGGAPSYTEEELFSDPYGILEKLASAIKEGDLGGVAGSGGNPASNESEKDEDTDILRDPFDPAFRPQSTARQDVAQQPAAATAPPQPLPAISQAAQPVAEAAAQTAPPASSAAQSQPPQADTKPAASPADPKSAARAALERKAQDISNQLSWALAQTPPGSRPNISVTTTIEGVLISLTDEFDFGMFAVGSSEPNPKLISAMEKVAKIIEKQSGTIVIRGHTDARPFKNSASDNWRLSSSRGLMARIMLVRGGLDAKRVERVEGYADQRPRLVSDPMAAQNRRIEILLREQTQ